MKIGGNFAFKKIQDESINMEFNYECATVEGVGIKTSILLGVTFLTTLVMLALILNFGYLPIFMYFIAIILTTILQIIINIRPMKAKSLAIPYAISEGLVIGCLCGLLEVALPNMGLKIASIALLATLSIFLAAIFLYTKKVIKVGNRFRGVLITAGLGVIIFTLGLSLLSLIMFFVNGTNVYSMFYFSGFGVILSIFMCILASLYVISSLSLADNLIQSGVEKTMEWYASYAITLNVIYLFIEILRLVIILVGRRNNN